MINMSHKGELKATYAFLNRLSDGKYLEHTLAKYGEKGVEALREATPIDTGKTANSWQYEIIQNDTGVSIVWSNTNVNNGIPIAVLIQYGHATGTGGYIEGIDYINPALKPIFEEIAQKVWRTVTDR